MKFSHFNAFKPICPLCLRDRSNKFFLEINLKFRETEEGIAEGILGCPNPVCRCEYPIIDGIPIIVPDIRTYISTNILPIIERTDLGGEMLSLLGDCCGPGSVFDSSRQHLSSYAFDHYGDLDPHEDKIGGTSPGSVLRLLKKGLSLVPGVVAGPVIDMGCAVGRTTFELAETFENLILGVDLNFDMLRLAASVMNNGEVTYPRRKVGLVYDLRRFKVQFKESARIDFWAVDATVLPFPDNIFGFAASLNLIDCVTSPYDHLKCLAGTLRPGACVILTTPYDWSVTATPLPAWLGGHSQRGENKGGSEYVLRSLLAKGKHPAAIQELELIAESMEEEWSVRLHERGVMQYRTHIAAVRKRK